jgi:hypothetical protein
LPSKFAGEKKKLTDVHGIALDTKNKLMYLANHGAGAGPRGFAFP